MIAAQLLFVVLAEAAFWPLQPWYVVTEDRVADSECPLVAGVYTVAGQWRTVAMEKGSEVPRIRDDGDEKLDVSPLAPRNRRFEAYLEAATPEDLRDVREDRFAVLQPSRDEMVIVEIDRATRAPRKFRFSAKEGDFLCRSGWIVFGEWSISGAGEGGAKQLSLSVRVSRLKDNRLIFQKHIDNRRSMFFIFWSRSIHETYHLFNRQSDGR